jgi:hypothetical protein
LSFLRVAVRLGDDHLALPVGIGADALALGGALRAQLVGHLLTLRLHSAVDRVGDVGHEVDALDADVDQLDAERLGLIEQSAAHVLHHLVALVGQHAAHGALGDLLVERGLHHLAQPALEVAEVGAIVADELARLGDAPLGEPVDHQALLLGGEDGARLGAVQSLDALVEEHHVLERRRQLGLEARLGDHFLDLAERVDHADRFLVDDEQRGAQDHQQDQHAGDEQSDAIHVVVLLSAAPAARSH